MPEASENHLLIIGSAGESQDTERVFRGAGVLARLPAENLVEVSLLKRNMTRFLQQLTEILDVDSEHIGPYSVAQIEVSAEIRGDGKIGLMGSSAQVGVSGGIKFVLTRNVP